MANNQRLASDSFQRANENPLSNGGTWTTLPTFSALQLIGNVVEASALSVGCGAYRNNILWPNDQSSEITLGTGGTGTSTFILVVRASTSVKTWYEADISPAAGAVSINR